MTVATYLILCAVMAPGLLLGLLVALGWIVYREAHQAIPGLIDETLSPPESEPVDGARADHPTTSHTTSIDRRATDEQDGPR